VTERRKTRSVKLNHLVLGEPSPVYVQSMTFTKTADREATLAQILELEQAGCDIVRFSVPDADAVKSIAFLKEHTNIPLVADIHFNYRLAIEAAEAGIDKIRINPGNIGDEGRIKEVVLACRRRNIPIRIGVNGGSLEKHILAKYNRATPEALVESAMYHVNLLEKFDFYDIVVSIKSSDVSDTIAANRLFAARTDIPLHLGVTEAGTERMGIIKSAIGIGSLLSDGIGDTIRVSLTADVKKEVKAARDILRAIGLEKGINVVSCPTCSRCNINVIGIAEQLETLLLNHKETGKVAQNFKVAIMGCAVNGPGEASDADIGIAGGNGNALLFRKGEIVGTIPEEDVLHTLMDEIEKSTEEK
jgi:1-hydroxy-2-methyl-2-(E)-butenyl 4-diphosphate synthase